MHVCIIIRVGIIYILLPGSTFEYNITNIITFWRDIELHIIIYYDLLLLFFMLGTFDFFFFFIYESSAKRIAIFYEFKGPGNVNENIHKTTIIIISRKVGLCEFSF